MAPHENTRGKKRYRDDPIEDILQNGDSLLATNLYWNLQQFSESKHKDGLSESQMKSLAMQHSLLNIQMIGIENQLPENAPALVQHVAQRIRRGQQTSDGFRKLVETALKQQSAPEFDDALSVNDNISKIVENVNPLAESFTRIKNFQASDPEALLQQAVMDPIIRLTRLSRSNDSEPQIVASQLKRLQSEKLDDISEKIMEIESELKEKSKEPREPSQKVLRTMFNRLDFDSQIAGFKDDRLKLMKDIILAASVARTSFRTYVIPDGVIYVQENVGQYVFCIVEFGRKPASCVYLMKDYLKSSTLVGRSIIRDHAGNFGTGINEKCVVYIVHVAHRQAWVSAMCGHVDGNVMKYFHIIDDTPYLIDNEKEYSEFVDVMSKVIIEGGNDMIELVTSRKAVQEPLDDIPSTGKSRRTSSSMPTQDMCSIQQDTTGTALEEKMQKIQDLDVIELPLEKVVNDFPAFKGKPRLRFASVAEVKNFIVHDLAKSSTQPSIVQDQAKTQEEELSLHRALHYTSFGTQVTSKLYESGAPDIRFLIHEYFHLESLKKNLVIQKVYHIVRYQHSDDDYLEDAPMMDVTTPPTAPATGYWHVHVEVFDSQSRQLVQQTNVVPSNGEAGLTQDQISALSSSVARTLVFDNVQGIDGSFPSVSQFASCLGLQMVTLLSYGTGSVHEARLVLLALWKDPATLFGERLSSRIFQKYSYALFGHNLTPHVFTKFVLTERANRDLCVLDDVLCSGAVHLLHARAAVMMQNKATHLDYQDKEVMAKLSQRHLPTVMAYRVIPCDMWTKCFPGWVTAACKSGTAILKYYTCYFVITEWLEETFDREEFMATVIETLNSDERLCWVLRRFREASLALFALHHKGICHGDVKPGNYMLRKLYLTESQVKELMKRHRFRTREVCNLFEGFESVICDIDEAQKSGSKRTLYTEGYQESSAPVCMPEKDGTCLDEKSDLFSLGITLAHWLHLVLTGQRFRLNKFQWQRTKYNTPGFDGDRVMAYYQEQNVLADALYTAQARAVFETHGSSVKSHLSPHGREIVKQLQQNVFEHMVTPNREARIDAFEIVQRVLKLESTASKQLHGTSRLPLRVLPSNAIYSYEGRNHQSQTGIEPLCAKGTKLPLVEAYGQENQVSKRKNTSTVQGLRQIMRTLAYKALLCSNFLPSFEFRQ